ncbi:amidohydrolase family protein [Adhaeribacter radiodurans]|uniref:Amidohydrolase family protein n=1 Tax=Adhaeribacter radiodurans TaxID=2745197 RepID=A0A7L7LCQ3_9BACT|nr:amidohydrolase family protein [Adhaeribacter radiodurans]QMU30618.1 amidohydrolase family protein [Adhaeribacter radiodurans]
MKYISLIFLVLLLFVCPAIRAQTTAKVNNKASQSVTKKEELFSVIMGGAKVGHLKVTTTGNALTVDYDYKNNGRGPTIKETIILNAQGFPIQWDIAGNTTFGNSVTEHFQRQGQQASWTDATGQGSATVNNSALYIDQFGSPYSLAISARALLKEASLALPALPGGQLQLKEMETIQANSASGKIILKTYALSGADLNPTYFILDEEQNFFAYILPEFIVIRAGFESEEKSLRQLAEKYSAERFEKLQAQLAHKYKGNLRIRNVRIFDPKTQALTKLASVLVSGNKIKSIDAPNVKAGEKETEIDGRGGTLIAGLYEMHGHVGDNDALLNIAAGVTSVRDMGNNNEVLETLIQKIESGILAGPRITRLGFIEGKSPFSANNGILVENEQQALEAVATYARKGFYGIKLYNSMNGDWAPAIVKKAHELNMPVTGHVPAFSNANAMLRAGFDEMTHINQVMLGWVLEPKEDTRTLLRLTALKRLPNLDLNGVRVKETLDLMVKNKVAIDPTLAIHEVLLLSRNGKTQAGTLDYIENMPANVQRGAKVAMANIASEEEDKAYRLAFDKIVATLKMMKERGLLIIPGTDMGGEFKLHRELELYQQLGYTPGELLKLGSYDMAKYLGHKDRGSIEPGMLADFFLVPKDPTKDLKAIKTISMVSRGGVIYFPSEIYPAFGIKPFIEKPAVK